MRRPSSVWLVLAITLMLLPPAIAVWDDSTGVVWVSQGELLSLGEHSLKVIDASIDEGVPFIEIKRQGRELYKGFIEADKPVRIEHEIYVEYLGGTKKVTYGPQIKLRVYQWVDGRIVNMRFPRFLNREAFYDVWIEVENRGVKDGVFTTQLTQAGDYDIRSGRYTLADGTIQPIILDLAFPLQNVYIPSSTMQRVEYNDVAPNRRQTSILDDPLVRAGISTEKNSDVVFNLYYKNQKLDSVTIPNVGYGRDPSGFIHDIEIPDVMVQNEEYESKAIITNGGPSSVSIDTGKLNLQLMTKGFRIGPSSNKLTKSPELQVSEDLLRKALLVGETDDWRFTITPHVPPGEYNLEFRLWQNRYENFYSTYDVFKKRVKVMATPYRLVSNVVVPPSVMVGQNIPVEVRLNNVGLGKLLNVNVIAPTLLSSPIKQVATIPTDSMMSLAFEVPAMIAGKAPLTVEVYQHKASNAKWNDPYSESGALLDSLTKTVEVLTGEEGPSLPPLPPSELPPQPARVEEGIIPPIAGAFPAPAASPQPAVQGVQVAVPPAPWQQLTPKPITTITRSGFDAATGVVAIAVLIVIIILLAIRVVWNYHRRSARFEAHDAVVQHVRKR